MRYQLFTYDLWGNDKDGYQVNDLYRQDIFELDLDNMTDKEIFKAIGIKPQSQNHVMFDNNCDMEYTLYIVAKKNHKPVCELRKLD